MRREAGRNAPIRCKSEQAGGGFPPLITLTQREEAT